MLPVAGESTRRAESSEFPPSRSSKTNDRRADAALATAVPRPSSASHVCAVPPGRPACTTTSRRARLEPPSLLRSPPPGTARPAAPAAAAASLQGSRRGRLTAAADSAAAAARAAAAAAAAPPEPPAPMPPPPPPPPPPPRHLRRHRRRRLHLPSRRGRLRPFPCVCHLPTRRRRAQRALPRSPLAEVRRLGTLGCLCTYRRVGGPMESWLLPTTGPGARTSRPLRLRRAERCVQAAAA